MIRFLVTTPNTLCIEFPSQCSVASIKQSINSNNTYASPCRGSSINIYDPKEKLSLLCVIHDECTKNLSHSRVPKKKEATEIGGGGPTTLNAVLVCCCGGIFRAVDRELFFAAARLRVWCLGTKKYQHSKNQKEKNETEENETHCH